MKEKIIDALRALSIEQYTIEETTTESAELFFIRKNLDIRRMKNVTSWKVRVYRNFSENGNEYLGMAEVIFAPGTSDEELKQDLQNAFDAAGNVKNQAYRLYQGETTEPVKDESALADLTPSEIALSFAKALFAADTRTDAFVNSAEIFAEKQTVTFTSSLGFTNQYEKSCCKGEYVTQCKEPEDVEQYFHFCYEDLTSEALTEKVEKSLNAVKDRAIAKKAPVSGVYDVILSDEKLASLLSFYSFRSMASAVHAGYFDSKAGESLQGSDVTGEKLNLSVVPSAPFSPEGVPMKKRELLADGALQFLQADVRYADYMQIEPTGLYRKYELDNGTVMFDELKKGCLYPVSFSDFQVDPMSSRFGGEIRLAYYFTGDRVEILTGGSINGNLLKTQGSMVFSKERYTDSSYEGPYAVKIQGVAVAGA